MLPLSLIQQQQAYYCARAAEYDQWWLRQGRYDRGTAANEQWHADAEVARQALHAFHPRGRVLEIACGTGLWTHLLASTAEHVTALDGSAEMLAMNAAKLATTNVDYVQADVFEWHPQQQFDAVFFSFWLSHVPAERFEAFWATVAACLAPGGRVFFLDSTHEPTSTASNHKLEPAEESVQLRKLNDGREFHIYKIFYSPTELTDKLRRLGWDVHIEQTQKFFIYGSGMLK